MPQVYCSHCSKAFSVAQGQASVHCAHCNRQVDLEQKFECPDCQNPNDIGAKRCKKCQTFLFEKCLEQECNGDNRIGAEVCGDCGADLAELRQARWNEMKVAFNEAVSLARTGDYDEALEKLQPLVQQTHAAFAKAKLAAQKKWQEIGKEKGLSDQIQDCIDNARFSEAEAAIKALVKLNPRRKAGLADQLEDLKYRAEEKRRNDEQQLLTIIRQGSQAIQANDHKTALGLVADAAELDVTNKKLRSDLQELTVRAADLKSSSLGKLSSRISIVAAVLLALASVARGFLYPSDAAVKADKAKKAIGPEARKQVPSPPKPRKMAYAAPIKKGLLEVSAAEPAPPHLFSEPSRSERSVKTRAEREIRLDFPRLGKLVKPIVLEPGGDVTPTLSADGKQVSLTVPRPGDRTLYVWDEELNVEVVTLDVRAKLTEKEHLPPAELAAEPDRRRVSLSWKKDDKTEADVTGYKVYRKPAGEGRFVMIKDGLGPEATRFVDESVEPGTQYVYCVTASAPPGDPELDNTPRESRQSKHIDVETPQEIIFSVILISKQGDAQIVHLKVERWDYDKGRMLPPSICKVQLGEEIAPKDRATGSVIGTGYKLVEIKDGKRIDAKTKDEQIGTILVLKNGQGRTVEVFKRGRTGKGPSSPK